MQTIENQIYGSGSGVAASIISAAASAGRRVRGLLDKERGLLAKEQKLEFNNFEWKKDFVALAVVEEMKRVVEFMTNPGWSVNKDEYYQWVWDGFIGAVEGRVAAPLYDQMSGSGHATTGEDNFFSHWAEKGASGAESSGEVNFKVEFIRILTEWDSPK